MASRCSVSQPSRKQLGVGPTPRAHPRKDAGSLWHRTRETSIPLQIPLRLQTPGDYLRCPHNALLLGMPHPSNTPASLAFLERLIGGTMPFLTSEPLTPALPALSPFLPSPHLTPGMLEGGKLLSPLGVTFSPYRPQDILQTHQIPSLFVLISVCSALTGQRHRLRPPCAWSIVGVEQTLSDWEKRVEERTVHTPSLKSFHLPAPCNLTQLMKLLKSSTFKVIGPGPLLLSEAQQLFAGHITSWCGVSSHCLARFCVGAES